MKLRLEKKGLVKKEGKKLSSEITNHENGIYNNPTRYKKTQLHSK